MQYIKIPLKTLLNITKIITIYYYDFSPNYKSGGDIHDFWEIVYVDSGEVDLQSEETIHHLKQGQLIFHKPNEYHRVYGDGTHTSSVFIITFVCNSPAMKFFNKKIMTVSEDALNLIKMLVEECIQNFKISVVPLQMNDDAPIGGLQLVQNYLECFLIRLMRAEAEKKESHNLFFTSHKSFESDLANDITEYLKANIYNKVTLEMLSEHFHFSVSTLCSVFRKSTGQTIIHMLMQLRIDEAKRLLCETKMSIGDISEKLGFDSPQHFSRTFSKYTEKSPRDFRRSPIKKVYVGSTKKQ